MKKNKIFCLVICTLMIVTVYPVASVPLRIGEDADQNSTTSQNNAPQPGYAIIPYFESTPETTLVRQPLTKSVATMDDIVIGIIQQVDESIYLRYLENLTGFGPRRTGTAACISAATYIYTQFQSMGLWVRYHPWSNGGYSSNNVEATINGTDTTSDAIYIICGHYDTVSNSPGADDDASGTVAVLVAAYVMSQYQFNYTIKFVAFSGEEQGLLGSEVYAQEAFSQGWNIEGVLNCDMISYAVTTSDGNNVKVYENTASEWLYTYTVNICAEYNQYIRLTLHHAGTSSGSDHYYFWQRGYSAVFYYEYTTTPYYHTSGDTIDHINATYAVKNVRLVLATLAELAEARPLSNPPAIPTLTGPNYGVIDELYTYTAVTTEPDGEDVSYYFEWGDGTNSGWLGPYPPGQQTITQKSWGAAGTYTVRTKAKDIHQVASGWSEPISVTILTDRPPNTPTIDGLTEGKPGTTYVYELSTIDLDGDMVYYYINWGDGQTTEWVGPYNSGSIAPVSHQWAEKGNYTIQAKARDIYEVESGWVTLEVTMPLSVEQQTSHGSSLLYQLRLFIENLRLGLLRR